MKTVFALASASFLSLAAIVLPVLPAQSADSITAGDLTITTPWTRATPGASKAGGGFMVITNNGSETDRLVAGSSERAAKVEFHEMSMKDGIMVMRPVSGGIAIEPGASVELKPGGYHVMYMGLPMPFKAGETIDTELTFEKAGTVIVPFHVEKIGAKAPAMDHGSMKHETKDHGSMDHGDMEKSDQGHQHEMKQ